MIRPIAWASCFHRGFLARELLPPERRQPVVLELAVPALRGFPLRAHPLLALQAMERRIERSVLDLQHVVGGALDVLGDVVAVGGPEAEGPQDQHVERALQQVDPIA